MWKSTDFANHFSLNKKYTLLPYNSDFLEAKLMDEQYFNIDSDQEDNNIRKMNNEISQIENKSLGNISDLNELFGLEQKKEKSEEIIKQDNFIKDKKSIEEIQLKVKQKIYSKRPFKEKKTLGWKRKLDEGLGEHNKFSDDNILRKCKHVVLNSILSFINKKIKIVYSNEDKMILKEKRLLKLKQNQSINSKTNYNKTLFIKH